MFRIFRVRQFALTASICLIFLAGCSKGVTVSGTVKLPSEIALQKTDIVSIVFIPESKDGRAPLVSFFPDDKTLIARQVLPGKYKIAVNVTPYMAIPDSAKRAKEFETFNKAFDRINTKLAYEVTGEGDQSITVDFAKGKVTKN